MSQEYKSWIQNVFNRSANDYGEKGSSYFNRFGAKLVDFANLDNCQNILDVATGKGAVLSAVAKKLNNHANIYGIDLSAEMIKLAQASMHAQKNIHLQQMDAEDLQFPDHYFDAIFCAFGLFFFPNPQKALREFRRILKKESALYLSLWDGDTIPDAIIQNDIKKFSITQPITANNLESTALQDILHELGFQHVRFQKLSSTYFYDDLGQWWDSLWSHAFRGYLEKLSEAQLQELKTSAFEQLKPYVDKDGRLKEEIPAIFIEAK